MLSAAQVIPDGPPGLQIVVQNFVTDSAIGLSLLRSRLRNAEVGPEFLRGDEVLLLFLLGLFQHLFHLLEPAVEFSPLLGNLLLAVSAKGHLPEDDFSQVQGTDGSDVPFIHLIAKDLRPGGQVVGIALRVGLEVGQPIQLIIGESVRTGEGTDLGIEVEIGEQLVIPED